MTREEQERVAREILGWEAAGIWWIDPRQGGEDAPIISLVGAAATPCEAEWLWPLETALMRRGWDWDNLGEGRYKMRHLYRCQVWTDIGEDRGEIVNAAALIDLP